MSEPPAVQQQGLAVLLQGRGVTEIFILVEAGLKVMQNQGIKTEQMARLHRHRDALAAAHDDLIQVSRTRHELPVYVAVEAHSKCQGGADWLSVAEAAGVLGWDIRRTQRLAQKLHGSGAAKRIGNTWALNQAPVLALKQQNERRR